MIVMDPAHVTRVVLPSDAERPVAERPTFLIRSLSKRERGKFFELWKQHDAETSDDRKCDLIDQALAMAIVGGLNGAPVSLWSNSLDDSAIGYLLGEIIGLCQLSEADKKKSAPLSTSADCPSGPMSTPAASA